MNVYNEDPKTQADKTKKLSYLGISGVMSSLTLLVTTLQARVKNPGARQDCKTVIK
jgi:hypothetical protein